MIWGGIVMNKRFFSKEVLSVGLSLFLSGSLFCPSLSFLTVNADEQMVPYLEYGFDNKLEGWQTTGAPRVGFDNVNPHSGTSCITISNRTDNSYSMAITAYDMFSTGYKYGFSVWFYQTTETDQVMEIMGRTQNSNEFSLATGTVPPNQWTEVKGECVVYETDPLNYIFISTENGTIDYELDDFKIYRQESSPILKSLDNVDYSNQMPYQESVASQQKEEEEKEKREKEKKSQKVTTTEASSDKNSIQKINKEEDSSDKSFVIILICGIIFTLICLGISSVILLSRKKKNNIASSSIDPLTKIPNKTEYENAVLRYINNPDESSNIIVLICSVCFINYINDNYGTETGDLTLVRCANCLKNALGSKAKIYRSNGNEFMCFSETSMIESVKKALEEESKTDKGYPFACAVGEASCHECKSQNSNSDIRNAIMKADKMMEQNKEIIVNETHLGRHFPNQKK